MTETVAPRGGLRGVVCVPGDKSISHRAVMLSAIADGAARIEGFLDGEDCCATIDCFRALGVPIEQSGDVVTVYGRGLYGLSKPEKPLYVANSGTTIRLLSGILAAQPFDCVISGDQYIEKRPMNRVIAPLRQMGAAIESREGGLAPLAIRGGALAGFEYAMPVASAQVKSCVLLAGLYADGETAVIEPAFSRDHTETMLKHMGADIRRDGARVTVRRAAALNAVDIRVPGDISSAAFLIVAALITEGSCVTIRNVGVNGTRAGILDALAEMGADIALENRRLAGGEWVADITVRSSKLKGGVFGGDLIPRLIDEAPVLAVAALFADGETVVRDAAELRVKETDRIAVMAGELRKLGGDIEETGDGFVIRGGRSLKGGEVSSHGDHRVAMSLAVAGLGAKDETAIDGAECCAVSFPGFFELLKTL